jgi:hypothetical protein
MNGPGIRLFITRRHLSVGQFDCYEPWPLDVGLLLFLRINIFVNGPGKWAGDP